MYNLYKDNNSEINALMTEAHTAITDRDVAIAFVNAHIDTLPQLVNGYYMAKYIALDNQPCVKEQDLSKALWTVILSLVLVSTDTTHTSLSKALHIWITEDIKAEYTFEQVKLWTTQYILSMQEQNILNKERTIVTKVIDNVDKDFHAFTITKLMETKLLALRKDLCNASTYKCAPLQFPPMEWRGYNTGISDDANMPFIKNGNKHIIAQSVLNAVNKLQSVPMHRSNYLHPFLNEELKPNAQKGSEEDAYNRQLGKLMRLQDTAIYTPLTLDRRGRMYARSGDITYQGTEIQKAMFQFHNKVQLGKDGFTAIQIHLANCLGYDKLSMNNRISAIATDLDSGMFDDIEEPFQLAQKYKKIDTFQAFVALMELKAVLQWEADGYAIETFESNLVCHRDGTANGIQHISALTQNSDTARMVNCTPATADDTPIDLYKEVSQVLIKVADASIREWFVTYGRDITKKSVMIAGYGATALAQPIIEYLEAKGINVTWDQGKLIATAIKQAIFEVVPALTMYTEQVKLSMELVWGNGITRNTWVTPDGFIADMEYLETEQSTVRAGEYSANSRAIQVPHHDKTLNAMPPNLIHSLDATHVRMVALACDWDLVTVHDSIGSHPSNFFKTGEVIREQFVKLHQTKITDALFQDTGVVAPRFNRGDYKVTDALGALYMFS